MMNTFLTNGITGHRGNPTHFPENTLPGFADAIAAGVDWIELDVHLTQDRQLVVCHDHTTGRTADQDLVIAECSLADLQTLDTSCGFRNAHPQCGTQTPVTHMPLLEDVLDLIMAQARTRLSIQPKMDCVADIAALIEARKASAWIGFNDGDVRKLRHARNLLPDAYIFLDTGPDPRPVEEDIALALEARFQAIVMHQASVTPERTAAIRAAGLEPGAWTVNSSVALGELRNMGVRRFYTDRPREFLAELGQPAHA